MSASVGVGIGKIIITAGHTVRPSNIGIVIFEETSASLPIKVLVDETLSCTM